MHIASIIMQSPMVRATLERVKTVTRRLSGLEKINLEPDRWEFCRFYDGYAKFTEKHNAINEIYVKCRYGKGMGDILYLRETYFILEPEHCKGFSDRFRFKAHFTKDLEKYRKECIADGYEYKWVPGIHMPKKHARIWLEIINITCERINDISDIESLKEGIRGLCRNGKKFKYGLPDIDGTPGGLGWPWKEWLPTARKAFKSLWCRINGIESWNKNPWCWVIEFKLISTTGMPENVKQCLESR